MNPDMDRLSPSRGDTTQPAYPAAVPAPLFRDSPRTRATRQIREWIEDGTLPAGQPLPVERELAERLDLPRSTVARAIDTLITSGLVRLDGGHVRTVVGPRRDAPLTGTVAVLALPLDDGAQSLSLGHMDLATSGALAELRALSLDALVLDPRRTDPDALVRKADLGIGGIINVAGGGLPRIDPAVMAGCMQRLRDRGVATVALGDESGADTDRVVFDHAAGAEALVAHLVARGRRRPAQIFLGGIDLAWAQQRRAGYEQAMRAAGLDILPPVIIPSLPDAQPGDEAGLERQARHVLGYLFEWVAGGQADALMLLTDREGPAVRRACTLLGKDPDRAVLLVGYDAITGHWDSRQQWVPDGLSASIDKQIWKAGQALAQLLAWRLGNGSANPARRVLVAPRLLADDG